MKRKICFYIDISKEVAPVWEALTKNDQLIQWLCEKAEVDDQNFKIKSTVPFMQGDHKIISSEPFKRLELEWVIEGFSTHVTFDLESDNESTKFKVTHIIEGDPPFSVDDSMGNEGGVLYELWAYNLGLLKTFIELGDAKCRLDVNRKPTNKVIHEMKLESQPEEVFQTLTDPEKIKGWNSYANQPVVEKKVGGRYSFGWKSEESKKDGPGEVVEYEEGRKITYTWYGNPQTLVSWEVEPIGEDSKYNSKLKLVHSGFITDQNMLVEYNLGWAGFLQGLALFADKNLKSNWCHYAN